ncbi:MAG: GNAT family N-acetyltransferase [Clostridiales bacterium]|nr:GNAT family N-acetyltransferase [Clostridiales bacterium]
MAAELEYRWTDGYDPDFGRFYEETERYYSSIVGGLKNRTGFVAYNISESVSDVLIATDNGTAVACAGLKRYSDTDVEIKRVWVEPSARRRGIAGHMMALLEAKAKEQGYKRLILQTRPIMPDAVGLYEKLGYSLIDNYPPYDKLQGAICFAKGITDDNA